MPGAFENRPTNTACSPQMRTFPLIFSDIPYSGYTAAPSFDIQPGHGFGNSDYCESDYFFLSIASPDIRVRIRPIVIRVRISEARIRAVIRIAAKQDYRFHPPTVRPCRVRREPSRFVTLRTDFIIIFLTRSQMLTVHNKQGEPR
jgi:hypothetical protein